MQGSFLSVPQALWYQSFTEAKGQLLHISRVGCHSWNIYLFKRNHALVVLQILTKYLLVNSPILYLDVVVNDPLAMSNQYFGQEKRNDF